MKIDSWSSLHKGHTKIRPSLPFHPSLTIFPFCIAIPATPNYHEMLLTEIGHRIYRYLTVYGFWIFSAENYENDK